jgi:hypothetical protein
MAEMSQRRVEICPGGLLLPPGLLVSFQRYQCPPDGIIAKAPSSLGVLPLGFDDHRNLLLPLGDDEAFWIGFSFPVPVQSFWLAVKALTSNGDERDAIGGGFWHQDQPKAVRFPGTQRLDGLLRGDGCFDALFRYTSTNRRYFLKELHVKLCDSKTRKPVVGSAFDGVLLHLESYASFSRLTGHPPPEPLDPTAGYGGWYLP